MSIDMQQFKTIFFEEVSEHLCNMESLIVAMDVASPSEDDLNAIFRAAHSIKGGASMFAFDDMTEVTHALETLLDRLRKKEITLTTAMIDAFLQATDILVAQKNAHQQGSPDVDQQALTHICKLLQTLASATPSSEVEKSVNPSSTYKSISFLVALGESCEHLFEQISQSGQLIQDVQIIEGFSKWQLQLFDATISNDELFDLIAYIAVPESIVIHDIEAPRLADCFEHQTQLCNEKNVSYTHSIDPPDVAQENHPDAVNTSALSSEHSIRVNTEKVDQLINQVGELVITQAMLMQIATNPARTDHNILLEQLNQLQRNTHDLQESVMSMRMVPIRFVFARFARVVRDLASKFDKQIELTVLGDETEFDKGLVEQLADPLTHLIRNSIDHGIEKPAQRTARGKPETGRITLQASYEGSNVVINISDDGAGLNRQKIIATAQQQGLDIDANSPDADIHKLIFDAGFSTAEQITDVSGRGVGMDVVKRNIDAMGGQITIHSEANVGTAIAIRLPLTLAILDGMSISVAQHIYIIPLAFISESLQPRSADIKTINGIGRVVKVRGDYIPLLALHELFNIDCGVKHATDGILVLLESNNKKIALLVDQLEGQQQFVFKSLEKNFHAITYISGATILGDGSVALILDVARLVSESS